MLCQDRIRPKRQSVCMTGVVGFHVEVIGRLDSLHHDLTIITSVVKCSQHVKVIQHNLRYRDFTVSSQLNTLW